jgi:3-methyladenine DNA glycosylase/8-oxoguanine DNA glycosylase
VRVLRQDPVECVFQFLCSSNNNMKRIKKMMWTLASYHERLGEVGGFVFHRFPTIERLARVLEQELRDARFGYRSALGAFLPVAFGFYATSISCYVCFILYYSSSSV